MNNYWTIMAGHSFSKLYTNTIHLQSFEEIERRHFWARGKARFKVESEIDHILALQARFEVDGDYSSKVMLLC